jgi:hypothetical protein
MQGPVAEMEEASKANIQETAKLIVARFER